MTPALGLVTHCAPFRIGQIAPSPSCRRRKVHALVDTEGLPLRVVVHSAAIQDRDGGALVLDRIRQRFNWLELVWADGGYNARQVEARRHRASPSDNLTASLTS